MALNNEGANSETTQNYPVSTFHKKNSIQYSTGTGIYVIQGYKIFVYTWFVCIRTYIHGIIMSGFGDISTVQFENWSRNVKVTRYALVTHE